MNCDGLASIDYRFSINHPHRVVSSSFVGITESRRAAPLTLSQFRFCRCDAKV
jgi:hypothetical protein